MNEKEFSQQYGRRVQLVSCLNFENRVQNETEEGREGERKRGRGTLLTTTVHKQVPGHITDYHTPMRAELKHHRAGNACSPGTLGSPRVKWG